jgi:cytidylate kinase
MAFKNKKQLIVAIDGPAGSGKSTVAKLVAKKLGFLYIDTGAMYRALTLKALKRGLDLDSEEIARQVWRNTRIDLRNQNGKLRVLLDGKDVSRQIRTPQLTRKVFYLARLPKVRARMVKLQRKLGKEARGAVLEGRDIGTVVFPDARWKFYLDAAFSERCLRRFRELSTEGVKVSLTEMKRDLRKRDYSDLTRKVGPLKKAKDAHLIDTTHLGIPEVVEKILRLMDAAEA